MTLATLPDVSTSLLRDLTAAETNYCPALLDRAEAHLRGAVANLLEWADDSEAYREMVVSIEADMVARVFRNPGGLVTETEGLYTYRLDLAVASGHLVLTPDELFRLRRIGPIRSMFGDLDGYARARYGRTGTVPTFLTGG